MEFSKIKCLSHLESDQSQLLALTHPCVCAGRGRGRETPKQIKKWLCQWQDVRVSHGAGALLERQGGEKLR